MPEVMSHFRQSVIFLVVILTFSFFGQAFAKDEDCKSNRGGCAFPLPRDRIVDGYSNPLIHKTALLNGTDERLQVNPRKAELNRNHNGLGDALDAVVHFYQKVGDTYYELGTGALTGTSDTVIATAHQFYYHAKEGSGRVPTSSIIAVVAGCPNVSYRISGEDVPEYVRSGEHDYNDVAYLRLARPACATVRPLLITQTDDRHVNYFSQVENSIVAAGAYHPSLIKTQREESWVGQVENAESHSNRSDSKTLVTYYSMCRLDGTQPNGSSIGARSMYKHLCDTAPNGSGGPILAFFPSVGWRIIAVQKGREPHSTVPTFNRAVPTNDSIYDRAAKFLTAPGGH